MYNKFLTIGINITIFRTLLTDCIIWGNYFDRMKDDKNSMKRDIVNELHHILDNSNSYVKSYRQVRDTLIQEDAPQIKLRILGKRGYDGRRYNMPTASEVAALVVGNYDAADFERDVVVEERSGFLKRISVFQTSYLPLQYPLIFSRGEDGFRRDIKFSDRPTKKPIQRTYVSMKEWFAYKIQQRDIVLVIFGCQSIGWF